MDAYLIGNFIGALLLMRLLSFLAVRALKRMGDNRKRVLVSHFVTFAGATLIYGLLSPHGVSGFFHALLRYGLATALWVWVDLYNLRERRAKTAEHGAAANQ